MGTTAIFAEILIIGLETLAWILLAVAAFFGPAALDPGVLGGNDGLALLLVVAAAYALGVLFDRFADSVLLAVDPWVDSRITRYRRPPLENFNTMRIRLLQPDLGVVQFLEYQRSRIRVARGTVVNLLATVVAAEVFFVLQRSQFTTRELVVAVALIPLLGIALVAATYDIYRRIQDAYLKMLNRAYQILILDRVDASGTQGRADAEAEAAAEGAAGARPIVAGVVHRAGQEGVEFLLVRTKDGSHWTFPKGHVERREDPRDAVAREVAEEAGVRGAVAPEPLATYRYPPTRRGQSEDSDVTAFLVAFADQGEAEERRGAGWFGPAKAKVKLAEGRSDAHATSAAAVVDAALKALGATER